MSTKSQPFNSFLNENNETNKILIIKLRANILNLSDDSKAFSWLNKN
tara:strand:- start:1644 stop:1784 length:141 start_codon:yes stop_codon:yes gene_type:complete